MGVAARVDQDQLKVKSYLKSLYVILILGATCDVPSRTKLAVVSAAHSVLSTYE